MTLTLYQSVPRTKKEALLDLNRTTDTSKKQYLYYCSTAYLSSHSLHAIGGSYLGRAQSASIDARFDAVVDGPHRYICITGMPLQAIQPSYLAPWYQHVLVMRCEDIQPAVASLCPHVF